MYIINEETLDSTHKQAPTLPMQNTVILFQAKYRKRVAFLTSVNFRLLNFSLISCMSYETDTIVIPT
jgi:hypothetical protein